MSDPITRSGSYYSVPRDANRVPGLFGVSSANGTTPLPIEVDPSSGGILVYIVPGGGGSLPTTPKYGQTTISVTNTAVQLPSKTLTVGVIVQALAGNVNNVVIGDSAVTAANGFQLQPGQATSAALANVNDLYVNGTAGDGVCFIGS